jgi:hypothetical protein
MMPNGREGGIGANQGKYGRRFADRIHFRRSASGCGRFEPAAMDALFPQGLPYFPAGAEQPERWYLPVAVSTERQCVSVPVEPIYLVIQDTALRSSLTAWLGLAGHSIVALQDLTTLIASRPAATGLFVIEANLLPESREDWIGILEQILPCDRCIVLIPGEGGQHGPLMLADRRGSLVVIQKAIARLEGLQLVG